MKQHFVFLIVLLSSFSVIGQPDTEKKNAIKIPAIETEKNDSTPSLVIKPNSKIDFSKVNSTNNGTRLDDLISITKPKEEFSMIDKSELRNPGEIFEKRFNAVAVEQGLTQRPRGDQILGTYKTRGSRARLRFRDFGSQDGDYVRIFINKDIIVRSTMLTNGYQSYDLILEPGMTYEIYFVALNQGQVGPNTAQLEVYDDNIGLLTSKQWNLRTGEKAILEIQATGLPKEELNALTQIKDSISSQSNSKTSDDKN